MRVADEFRPLLDFDADLGSIEGVLRAVRRWYAGAQGCMSPELRNYFMNDMELFIRRYMEGRYPESHFMDGLMATCLYLQAHFDAPEEV